MPNVRIPWWWSQAWYETANRWHEAHYNATRAYHARALETHDTIRDIPAIKEEATRCKTGE